MEKKSNEIEESDLENLKIKEQRMNDKKKLDDALKDKDKKAQRKKILQLKSLEKLTKSSPRVRTASFRRPTFTPTKQQQFFMTFMGGRKTFGTGQNLPFLNHALTSGGGLLKHNNQRATGRLFGF